MATARKHEFPMARTCPFAPPPVYEKILEEERVSRVRLPEGGQAWLVSRHEDVRTVLNDRRFSADRQHPDFPQRVKGGAARRPDDERTMVTMGAPDHGTARRAVLGEFTVRRMESLRPRIQEIVDQQVDALLAGPKPGDLVKTLALPVPSLVICEMLGVPNADHDFFQENTAKLINCGTSPEDRWAASETVQGYMAHLIAEKEKNPPDDLLGRQIVKLREEGTYRRPSLAALGFLLLGAGHETTASMISVSTVAFLRNPEQLAAIKADPGKTLDAVEEMLRYLTIGDVTARLCVEDIEVGGHLIKAGEGVLAWATPPTATRGRSTTPTSSTSTAARVTTSRSASGRTSASARTWPGRNCRSSSTPCSAGCRAFRSQPTSTTCRSRTTRTSTACTGPR
ncbi:Cytochrome P450 [Amycolatopsis lurida]|nr:Cytochrome P450 [Amycolatopsis lurida]